MTIILRFFKTVLIIIIIANSVNYIYPKNAIVNIKIIGKDTNYLQNSLIQVSDSKNNEIRFFNSANNNLFEIKFKNNHWYKITFSALNYFSFSTPFYIPHNIDSCDIEIILQHKYLEYPIEKVFFVSSLNNYKVSDDKYELLKSNGIYQKKIEISNIDTLRYNYIVKTKGDELFLPGHLADFYDTPKFISRNNSYIAVLINNSDNNYFVAKFNPKMYSKDKSNDFNIKSNNKEIENFINNIYYLKNFKEAYRKKQKKFLSNNNINNFVRLLPDLFLKLENLSKDENNLKSKKFIYMEYLNLSAIAILLNHEEKINNFILKDAFKNIDPKSDVWSIWNNIPGVVVLPANLLGEKKFTNYIDTIAFSHPDTNIRKSTLVDAIEYYGLIEKNIKKAKKYYNEICSNFTDLKYDSRVLNIFPLNIIKGNRIPNFEVLNINDTTNYINNNDLIGKYFLINFWATWCSPCINEIKLLNTIYKDIQLDNFNILSISVDEDLSKIIKFKHKYEMNWLNGWIKKGNKSSILKKFDVYGLPKNILINIKGIILESDLSINDKEEFYNLLKNLKIIETNID